MVKSLSSGDNIYKFISQAITDFEVDAPGSSSDKLDKYSITVPR